MNQTLIRCDAIRLEGAQRLTFLPDVFGGDFITSEASIYAYARRYCPDYVGGFWQFYRLPDGGGFMAPDMESLTFCNAENWFEQTVSGEVAGIILTGWFLITGAGTTATMTTKNCVATFAAAMIN